MNINSKRVLITGASSGIGRALVGGSAGRPTVNSGPQTKSRQPISTEPDLLSCPAT